MSKKKCTFVPLIYNRMHMYRCKYTRLRVQWNICKMAKRLRREHIVDDNTVFMVILSGGVWFSNQLFNRLGDIPNEVYYIKGHSYEGKERGNFVWDLLPDADLSNRDVIVIDDICDSGETLKATYLELKNRVRSIQAVTLLKRLPCPAEVGMPVWACIEDESKDFFVGCGLDDNSHGRLIRKICIC